MREEGWQLTHLKPHPGMPMAWRTKNTSWTKKMKKKTKKLNELSLLQREKKKSVGVLRLELEKQLRDPLQTPPGPHVPESLIHRAVPADEGAGGEEQEPEHGQPKAGPTAGVHTEPGQAGEEIQDKSQGAA